MSPKVYITGIGTISALGDSVPNVFDQIQLSRTGIDNISILKTKHAETLLGGEIKYTNSQLERNISGLKKERSHSRTALLGMIAAKEAAEMSGWDYDSKLKTAVVSATSVGGMDCTENFYEALYSGKVGIDYEIAKTHDCGQQAEEIAHILRVKNYITTLSTACSSAVNAIIHGTRLIRQGLFDRVVVGGTDAYSRFTINGFNSLMILSDEQTRPFDKNRKGLNLGEGAGYLILESEKSIQQKSKTVLCQIKGYGNACDAYHQTASSPDGHGAYLCMKQALEKSELSVTDIQYINTHGTGTINNDLSESIAMQRLFEGNVPLFSSTKSMTGHTLAASGGIEAVFCVLAIQHQMILPNLNFHEKMEDVEIFPQSTLLQNVRIENVLSNSFGFGGNNSSIIFSKC